MTEVDFDPTLPLIAQLPAPTRRVPDAAFLQLSGLERMRSMLASGLRFDGCFQLSGMQPSDVGVGTCTMAMPASPWWQTGVGIFTAGVLGFVADAPASGAILTTAPGGYAVTTSQLSLDFLRPATLRAGTIIGKGKLIHATRSQGLSEVFVEDGRGKLLAHGTTRCMIIPIDLGRIARPSGPPPSADSDGEAAPYQVPVDFVVRGQEYWDTTSGPDILREGMSGGYQIPFARFFGLRLIDFAEGEAKVGMIASEWLASGLRTIYGGALVALADLAANNALLSTLPAATAFSPLDLKVNFVRPAFPGDGEIVAKAKIVHRGRSIVVVHVEIIGIDGKHVAIATESILVLPGRPWARPVHVSEEGTVVEDGPA